MDKLCTVASSPQLAQVLRARLGPLAGTVSAAAVTLGVDLAPGRSRGAAGAADKLRARFRTAVLRHRRLKRIARRLTKSKRALGKIYVAGVKPAMTFGATVNAISTAEWRKASAMILTQSLPAHRGASYRAKVVLHGDPVWKQAMAPALQWAAEWWDASTTMGAAAIRLPRLLEIYRAINPSASCTLSQSKGPLQRARCCLGRIG